MPSKEVNSAVGAAPERVKAKNAVELLTEKRAALASAHQHYATAKANRDEVAMAEATRLAASLAVLVTELEQEVAGVREQEALMAANQRAVAISRAVGSVVASTVEDRERALEAARAYAEAINRLNERFVQYQGLVAEDAALRDRFGIAGAKIPRVLSPNETASVIAAARVVEAVAYATDRISRPQTEKDEHGLRERRTYGEIGGTPGYSIITKAGLPPFRPLTERESEAVADNAEEWKPDPVLAAAASEANALGNLGVPGGGIARG